jgi:ankyrin repeat protein
MNSIEITQLIIEELKKRLGFGQSNQLSKFMNEKTSEGYTALHYASCKGNIQIAKFLIENGAN